MSTYYFISFGLISFIFFASFLSCSSLFLPINAVYWNEYDHHLPLMNKNKENIEIVPINDASLFRNQRSSSSSSYFPRSSRNTWFRVSTYQHFKPSVSEEISNGDNLLRWGR